MPNGPLSVPPMGGNDLRAAEVLAAGKRATPPAPFSDTQTLPAPSTVMPSGPPRTLTVVSGAPSPSA